MSRSRLVRLVVFTFVWSIAVGGAVTDFLRVRSVPVAASLLDRLSPGSRSDRQTRPAIRAFDPVRQGVTDCRWCVNA